jgi:hypothetical protein
MTSHAVRAVGAGRGAAGFLALLLGNVLFLTTVWR